jgi:HAD superfamily hydrolase (TIGR01509 family)
MVEKIEAIIFDLGGVFIHIDYSATIKAFEKIGFTDAALLYSQGEQAELFQQYEIGTISTAHFINKLLPHSTKVISPNQVVQAWNAMIGEFEQNSIDVLKQLQGKVRVFMLSNTNELHLDLVIREWHKVESKPMDFYFEKVHVSHEFGMRKPHPETFLSVCNQHNLIPEKTLFIDDSIQHIEGAQKEGLQTVHLTSIYDLPAVISTLHL